MRRLGIVVVAAVVAPDVVRSALAAAAGTLFEAAPVALLAHVVPARFGRLAALVGCGCAGTAVPGALAPVAVALCWLSFGPLVALGRAAASVAVFACVRRLPATSRLRPRAADPGNDVFGELARLGACAAAAAVALPAVLRLAVTGPERVVAGILIGLLAPCAAAGVAIAAATVHHAPPFAAAILATCGVIPRVRLWSDTRTTRPSRDLRFPTALLATALAALAFAGPSGLVHPRFLPAVAAGAVAAAIATLRARPRRVAPGAAAAIVPALMLAALVAGAPPPPPSAADETALGERFPGETIAFTGVARTAAGTRRTELVRYVITCCRIDAVPVALALDRDVRVPDGTWIATRGVLVSRGGALVERVDAWRRVAAPHDPFAYA